MSRQSRLEVPELMRRFVCLAAVILLLTALAPAAADAATWYVRTRASGGPNTTGPANSCDRADFLRAVSSAGENDTVLFAANTDASGNVLSACAWTAQVNISKAITVKGAGSGAQAWVNGVLTSVSPCPCTVIVDHLNRTLGDIPMLVWATKNGKKYRWTHIRFKQSGSAHNGVCPSGNPHFTCNGSIQFTGNTKALRIDHSYFDHTHMPFIIHGFIWGVADHNQWTFPAANANGMRVHYAAWNDTGDYGDASWADDPKFGTQEAFFLENNYVDSSDAMFQGGGAALNDGRAGDRQVIRYNKLKNSGLQGHNESGRTRGTRLREIYNNDFEATDPNVPGNIAIFARTGAWLVWGNKFRGYKIALQIAHDRSYRKDQLAFWGPCGTWFNGSGSSWDENTNSSGYRCMDQPGMGKSDLLRGANPKATFPHSHPEPIRMWNNDYVAPPNESQARLYSVVAGPVVDGRDIFMCPDSSCAQPGA